MLTDIKRGVPTEIDFLNGQIVYYAAKYGVNVPLNMCLHTILKHHQA